MDTAQTLLDLGFSPSRVRQALKTNTVMERISLCNMLKTYWCRPAKSLSPIEVHFQDGLYHRDPTLLLFVSNA